MIYVYMLPHFTIAFKRRELKENKEGLQYIVFYLLLYLLVTYEILIYK